MPWYSVARQSRRASPGPLRPARGTPRSASIGCRKVVSAAAARMAQRRSPWTLLRRDAGERATSCRPTRGGASCARRRVPAPARPRRPLRTGFAFTSPGERRRSRGTALYYAWSPSRRSALHRARHGGRRRRRERQHRSPAVPVARPRAPPRRAATAARGRVRPPPARDDGQPDPRRARRALRPRPARRRARCTSGRTAGGKPAIALLMRHPNVVLYVAGHKHYDRVWPQLPPRRDAASGR